MAETPSPYAPGIISDEPVPPRPPGRVAIFLTAAFVVGVVASGMPLKIAAEALVATGAPPRALQHLFGIASIPITLLPLWAYLSDTSPLWGTRREGHLVLMSLMAAVAWVGIALESTRYPVWLAAAVVLGLASSGSRAAITGALAEIGQRRGITGPLAGAYIGLSRLAMVAAIPLSGLQTWVPVPLIAGVAAGLSLAVPLLVVALADRAAASPVLPVGAAAAAVAGVSVPRFLRSRAFWASMAVVICAGLATVPNELVVREGADGPVPWTSQAMLEASLLSAPVVYLLLSGRLPFGMLLRLSLVVKAFALVAGALAASGPAADATGAAFHARAAANSLLSCALTDLALRVAPRGREAFGAILLAGVTQIVIVMANAAESTMGLPIALVGCVAAGAAVTATLTVSLLPGPVFESSRRAVVGSPA